MDVTSRAVMEIMTKTIEYLQPNPGKCCLVQLEFPRVSLSLIDRSDLVGFPFLWERVHFKAHVKMPAKYVVFYPAVVSLTVNVYSLGDTSCQGSYNLFSADV